MVKENSNKPEQKRVYDVDGFKKRAACVCVKNENENEVCHLINDSFLKIYHYNLFSKY